jgi:hypothetical protein
MAQGTTRGVPIDIDPLLAADSDLLVPSQKAIKTYADTKISSVSATSPMVSTGGTSPTLLIPQATSSADGYLNSTDWSTFNNKQNSSTRRNANNSSNNNINYCGVALGTGVSESATVWTITRLTITASGSITITTATNVAWTNRESVIY